MFSGSEWRKNLRGCFEIYLFMSVGVDRFSAAPADAIKSFIIPAVMLPFTLFVILSLPEQSGGSVGIILPLHAVRILLSLGLTLMAVYFLTKQFGREEHFYQFLTCLLYTSPSPRDQRGSRMPSSA